MKGVYSYVDFSMEFNMDDVALFDGDTNEIIYAHPEEVLASMETEPLIDNAPAIRYIFIYMAKEDLKSIKL